MKHSEPAEIYRSTAQITAIAATAARRARAVLFARLLAQNALLVAPLMVILLVTPPGSTALVAFSWSIIALVALVGPLMPFLVWIRQPGAASIRDDLVAIGYLTGDFEPSAGRWRDRFRLFLRPCWLVVPDPGSVLLLMSSRTHQASFLIGEGQTATLECDAAGHIVRCTFVRGAEQFVLPVHSGHPIRWIPEPHQDTDQQLPGVGRPPLR